jgi:arginine exporter protein ArgO
VNGAPATIELPAVTLALESTEGIMTAAIHQREQADHEHIFGKAPADVVDDAVKALAVSPLNPAAVLDTALNALDARAND